MELWGQQVEYLSEEVWDYLPKDLNFLNFSSTNIRNLPEGISKLQNLKKLYFYTPIEGLSKEIEDLPNLKEVILPTGHGLSVTRFLMDPSNFKGVEFLDLNNKELDRVPYDIVRIKDPRHKQRGIQNIQSW